MLPPVRVLVADDHADVALLDLGMSGRSGLEAARALARCSPATRVVLLGAALTPAWVRAAREAGAVGYLLEGDRTRELLPAVLAVAAGETAWCAEAARVA